MKQICSRQDIPSLLRSHGLRATPQRIAVAEILFETPTHVTPQQTLDALKPRFPSISQNTIYLTLSHFEASGLLQRIFVDGKTIFDSNMHKHDHAYCRNCRKLIDLPLVDKEKKPRQISGWNIQGESRVWTGLCPACRKTETIPL